MMKKNRVEIERNNVTPKEFWSYCRREVKRRTGMNLEDWFRSGYGYLYLLDMNIKNNT